MLFSSVTFLFFFLPAVIVAYHLIPGGEKWAWWRNLLLLLASFVFYIWGSAQFFLVLICSIVADFILSQYVGKRGKIGRITFWLGISFNLVLLGYFKYANFFVEEFGPLLGFGDNFAKIALPLGISFFTFQKISYLVDVHRREENALKSIVDYALYIALFPQLIAGPIVRFSQISKQLRGRSHSFNKFFKGVYRFSVGLAMKVLIADNVGRLYAEVFAGGGAEASSLVLILGIFAYSMQIYFDFAGYSKMAIGLGEMFGFEFPMNFNRPYLSRSVTEFWRRWHITLSSFFKEYVYFPMGGSRVSRLKIARNLIFTFFLTGIWHGANWTFFVWGLYYGILIAAEKLWTGRVLKRAPWLFNQLLTFVIVYVGWILFQAESIGAAWEVMRRIVAFEGGMGVALLAWDLKMKVVMFAAAVAAFVPISGAWGEKLFALEKGVYFRSAMIVVLLSLSFISVAGSSFHPFLYFKF